MFIYLCWSAWWWLSAWRRCGGKLKKTCDWSQSFHWLKSKKIEKMPKIAQNPLRPLFQFNLNFFLWNLFSIMTVICHKVFCSRQSLARTNPLRSRQRLRFRASFGSKIVAGFVCQEFNIICCMWFYSFPLYPTPFT